MRHKKGEGVESDIKTKTKEYQKHVKGDGLCHRQQIRMLIRNT